MNLLLLEPDELDADRCVRVGGTRGRHLRTVLNVQPGQVVRVGIIDGPVGTGRVLTQSDDAVSLQCVFDAVPHRPPIDLLLALPRPKVLRRLWAQLAALGVGRVAITNAARVERNYFDTNVLDPTVYRPLLLEGLQQARDTRVPLVTVHRQFRILIEDDLDRLAGECVRLVAHPGAGGSIAGSIAADHRPRVLLAVGPEGGWNDFERDLLGSHGFVAVGIGQRILRSDTATIALLALAHEGVRARADSHAGGG